MTWEVAPPPPGKSEVLSEVAVFHRRPGRLEKAKLTETGGAFQAEGTSNMRSLGHRTKLRRLEQRQQGAGEMDGRRR